MAASMKLVMGPAIAIQNSANDFGGSDEISATPPNIKSVILLTLSLYFLATME